jgi:hypothetical protein
MSHITHIIFSGYEIDGEIVGHPDDAINTAHRISEILFGNNKRWRFYNITWEKPDDSDLASNGITKFRSRAVV